MAAKYSSSEDDNGTSYGCTSSSTPTDRVSKKCKSHTPRRPQHKASTSSETEVLKRLKKYHDSSRNKYTYKPAQTSMPLSATSEGIRRKGKAPKPQRSSTMSDDDNYSTESVSPSTSINEPKLQSFQCSKPSLSPFIYGPDDPGGCTVPDIMAAKRYRPGLYYPAPTESSEESSETDCNPLPTKRFKTHEEFDRRQDLSLKRTRDSKRVVAIDCEMVGCRPTGSWLAKLPVKGNKKRKKIPTEVSVAGRCAVVDYDGNVLYDKYIRPGLTIVDLRTCISGITAGHMAMATPFDDARREILEIVQDKLVVAHDIRHDLAALQIPQNVLSRNIRDTSTCQILRRVAGVPSTHPNASLRSLAAGVLGRDIQRCLPHSPVEDARIAMELHRAVEEEWEKGNGWLDSQEVYK